MKEKFAGWGGLILIYLAINGVLWVGQELYYSKDTSRMNEIETTVKRLDSELAATETSANAYGITEQAYASYSSKVDERNKLADEYNVIQKRSGSRFYLIPIPLGGKSKL